MSTHLSGARCGDLDGAIRPLATTGDILRDIPADVPCRRLTEVLDGQIKRIARALHDEAGQLLTAAHIALAHAARGLPPEGRERLQDVKVCLDQIEEQLRRVAHELRPRILDDLGLVPALEFLAQGVEMRRGLTVTIDAALEERLLPAVETTLYHLVQEALANTGKHACATRTVVRLSMRSRSLRCTVEDDGVGFDPRAVFAGTGQHGCGLIGIREQVMALGGTFHISSAPASGTRLEIAIPLAA